MLLVQQSSTNIVTLYKIIVKNNIPLLYTNIIRGEHITPILSFLFPASVPYISLSMNAK